MTEDLHEPLSLYRDSLRELHAQNSAAFFDKLVAKSQVDAAANGATVAQIRGLEFESQGKNRSKKWLQTALTLLYVIVALSFPMLVAYVVLRVMNSPPTFTPLPPIWGIATAVIIALALPLISKLRNNLKRIEETIADLTKRCRERLAIAWQQMTPLNKLYQWTTFTELLTQSVPRLKFDPYFSLNRLKELVENYGWRESTDANRSAIFVHSGTIIGNPFILAETLDFEMINKTYTGYKHISWREQTTDSDGKTRWVTRHQTLSATVTKPAPSHTKHKFLIYGSEAAPNLTFSRTPTDLSGLKDTMLNRWRKNRAIKKLEKLSRNLDDDSDYTIMANRKFEMLFNTVNRNNEVEFRLLFTPLAQTQMINLLEDQQIGFGDDFDFIKNKKINIITPRHLMEIDISNDPENFFNYDLQAARLNFLRYSNRFFRSLYFTFAPLLTIPLYQQHRSHATIYREVYGRRSAPWEHEALANYYGDDHFKHPDSITPNILKTTVLSTSDESTNIRVTAYGFKGRERTDYISTYGGDGRMHEVAVPWIEYSSVHRSTNLHLCEAVTPSDVDHPAATLPDELIAKTLARWQIPASAINLRRSILSYIDKQ